MSEQPTNPVNILKFALSRPRLLPVVVNKVLKRFKNDQGRYSEAESHAWIYARAVDSADIARKIGPDLWNEAEKFGAALEKRADRILSQVPFEMGAGGDYRFLYWLTRYLRPSVIVETGVSAGFTSQAFLAAMAKNGHGTLYSSDFPYFRVKDPEKYIGILVEDHLKPNWRLSIDGDENALPRIMENVPKIDIFHYDSDKSYSGRNFGLAQADKRLAPDGIVIVDDIRNDSWFREHAENDPRPHSVLNGRFGMIGEISVRD